MPAALAKPAATRTVHYHGLTLTVPRSWPVFDLSRQPATCVRFNRHAVYLGSPGANERCPAHAIGRTEAILVAALDGSAARAGGAPVGGGLPAGGSSGTLVERGHGISVTATWARHPAVIRRALGLHSLKALRAAPSPVPAVSARTAASAHSAAAARPGAVYTGPGFDVCSTPSSGQMSAWGSSRYRAIGVYIGGANMACSQSNLTSGWVSQRSTAGWHLIPIYVGLQAPSNSCGCASISPGSAASEGRAAASNAVAQAQAVGLGVGNPIMFDMEAYSTGGSNTSAVMSFLAAWTSRLHADGYKSGVYSSDGSGIADLVARYGSSYTEPDDLWMANWNESQTTSDPAVPAGDWAHHQRLHQYDGGHNETHSGVTLNIDGDYLDSATAAAGGSATAASTPSPSSPPTISGRAMQGRTLTESHGSWTGSPTSYAYRWEDCNARGNSCRAIPGATKASYVLGHSDLGHAVRVIETASNGSGAGAPSTSKATAPVLSPTPLPWLYTAYGNVLNPAGAPWYGSPAGVLRHGPRVSGMAATIDGHGYWLVDTAGRVFAYGDATPIATPRHTHPISGIASASGGGTWLITAAGNVYATGGATWYGSRAGALRGGGPRITAITPTADGRGYWLLDTSGRLFPYGDATRPVVPRHTHPISGIASASGGGEWLITAAGNVYATGGATWYGSRAGALRHGGPRIIAIAPTVDGRGYWLLDASGRLFAYGDAARLSTPGHPHPLTGLAIQV